MKANKINSYCFKVTILFFGKRIIKRDFYFEFEENENIIKLNLKKDYIITSKMHFNEEDILQNPDHLYLTYKSYSCSNKQFIDSQDQVHMLYKDMVLDNPYNQMETLIYFY
ncbi:hypothetical protein COB47_1893 [Caldicellulosiruptor obsidiansis OB47]|uniref:Uncharacterized protein n=1 Tax=Caldicellulosiruptor obsidiansis (strain ATCC BAA-2073 / JCM 16842 / OB47) TaxID=608506 RepID=D9TG42_CALOO|nr:hypothetical protein COB47_1893 [Caldicellulosiruptor obsidiansis OB47]